jgi:hypothetical protein
MIGRLVGDFEGRENTYSTSQRARRENQESEGLGAITK